MDKQRPLIHVGYPKCGSTLIQVTARQSVGDFRLVEKQTDGSFYRSFYVPEFEFNEKAVLRELGDFTKALLSFEGFLLNPFFTVPGAGVMADRVKRVFPDAHIVIVIRNQRDMLQSFASEWYSGGGTGRMRPSDFFRCQNLHMMFKFDLGYFCYSKVVRYFHQLFGENNVTVFLFEEIVRDLTPFFSLAEDVLNTKIAFEQPANPIRERISSLMYYYLRATNRWRRGFMNPSGGPFNIDLPRFSNLESFLNRLGHTMTKKKCCPIPKEFLNQLDEICSQDNAELAEIIGKDLHKYGYPIS